ncbi:GGDEF domain-containing protein [Clostridium sp. D2Q-11]|uniref:GGDEF domain-containing protein n=1 Tax=Anaeromonas frigoriresistens TaxID=2683708 RepID=A0A942UVI1_9FIRM|nr:diguanylate cyclase [Anaeromonas frigoriresistens]MBS4537196.1 GGDEF domain-containing protein [Anaeromonas frigoriresistens]
MHHNKSNIFKFMIMILGIGIFAYLNIATNGFSSIDILLFGSLLLVGFILEKIYIKIEDFKITLDSSIMLGSYFLMGLIPSLYLISILILVSNLMILNISKFKVLKEIGMFNLVFILSHYTLMVVGIDFNTQNEILLIVNYILFGIAVFIFNWTILYSEIFLSEKEDIPRGIKESFKWDLSINIIVIPLSIMLVMSYRDYGYLGIGLFTLILISANIMFRLLRSQMFLNNELKVIQEVAISISSRLDENGVSKSILNGIVKLINPDYCALLYKEDSNLYMDIIDYKTEFHDEILNNDIKKIVNSLIENKEKFNYMSSKIMNINELIKIGVERYNIPKKLKSILYQPLIIDKKLSGVIIVGSRKYDFFQKEHLQIFSTLSNQGVIAIENAKLYKSIKTKAVTDSLTGLYNQGHFFNVLDSLTLSCNGCNKIKCDNCNTTSLAVFDIDNFKKINDTYGHQTGDKILCEISNIIAYNVRGNDIVSRYGGDEFTVLLPNADQKNAYIIAERIRRVISETPFYSLNKDLISVTVSGGVSEYPTSAENGATLLAFADRAMYMEAKRNNKNKVGIYVN